MNVLVTSAGRCNHLLRGFRRALPAGGRVLVADVSADAPAVCEADGAFLVPPCIDPSYVDCLVAICAANDVSLLIPLNERELGVIAAGRERFLAVGAFPVVSGARVIAMCEDKWAANLFLAGRGLRTPRTWLSLADALRAIDEGTLSYPVVVKPRCGSTSIGFEEVSGARELTLVYELAVLRASRRFPGPVNPDKLVLIQERLAGDEYGIDVINDLFGRHVVTFARRKLRMRAGSTDRAVTVVSDELAALGRVLGEELQHVGCLDCDVFMSQGSPPIVVDMNPRVGGGLPFSQMAGANLATALVAWRRGERPSPCALAVRAGVCVAKFDDFVVME